MTHVSSEVRKEHFLCLFVYPVQKCAAANIVSFHLSQVIMKHEKPFYAGTIV